MENQTTTSAELVTTRSTGIRYGLIAGAIGIAYFLLLNLSGVNITAGYWNWIGYAISAVIVVMAHKYFKDNTNGFMSYGQGIGIAFWMGLIASVLSSIFTYIYVKFIDSNFMEMIREKQIEAMEAQGMSDEQIDQAMKFAGMFTTPEAMLIMGLIGGIIIYLILGLIITIFTQKKSPETAI